jgi:hypothetical protein
LDIVGDIVGRTSSLAKVLSKAVFPSDTFSRNSACAQYGASHVKHTRRSAEYTRRSAGYTRRSTGYTQKSARYKKVSRVYTEVSI